MRHNAVAVMPVMPDGDSLRRVRLPQRVTDDKGPALQAHLPKAGSEQSHSHRPVMEAEEPERSSDSDQYGTNPTARKPALEQVSCSKLLIFVLLCSRWHWRCNVQPRLRFQEFSKRGPSCSAEEMKDAMSPLIKPVTCVCSFISCFPARSAGPQLLFLLHSQRNV